MAAAFVAVLVVVGSLFGVEQAAHHIAEEDVAAVAAAALQQKP